MTVDASRGGRCWIVVTAVPAEPATGPSRAAGERLREWVRGQVAVWPAPIPIGESAPRHLDGAVTFAPARSSAGERYRCAFGADGSTLLALPFGSLRESPVDGVRVWGVGEGAVAWATVAALRLAASYAEHVGVRGAALVEVAVGASEEDGAAPYEVWNHGAHGFGSAGDRLAAIRPACGPVDLAACSSAGLAGVARPLVLDLLRQ